MPTVTPKSTLVLRTGRLCRVPQRPVVLIAHVGVHVHLTGIVSRPIFGTGFWQFPSPAAESIVDIHLAPIVYMQKDIMQANEMIQLLGHIPYIAIIVTGALLAWART